MSDTINNTVDAYPTQCCGPYWMCSKHHAEAMKIIGAPWVAVTMTSDYTYLPPVEYRK